MAIPAPSDPAELSNLLACAARKGEKLGEVNLSSLCKILEHCPEDMTVTVEAGMTLAALQAELRQRGQWLPIDPPHSDVLTISELLSRNLNGPRRLGFGTIRDWLIGIRVALADGTLIRSGGKVVKNVAGYDLMKAFIGSRGTLGIIVEATFKLRPLPEAEMLVETTCDSLSVADNLVRRVTDSDLCPTILDIHQFSGNRPTVVIGFSGSRDEVEWQIAAAKGFGIQKASSLDHDSQFWKTDAAHHTISVLPSRLCEVLGKLETPFLARAGNGIIYHRGKAPLATGNPNAAIMQRLKETFDPRRTLPDISFTK